MTIHKLISSNFISKLYSVNQVNHKSLELETYTKLLLV